MQWRSWLLWEILRLGWPDLEARDAEQGTQVKDDFRRRQLESAQQQRECIMPSASWRSL